MQREGLKWSTLRVRDGFLVTSGAGVAPTIAEPSLNLYFHNCSNSPKREQSPRLRAGGGKGIRFK